MAGLKTVDLASPQKPSPADTSSVLHDLTGEPMQGTADMEHDRTRKKSVEKARTTPTNAVPLAGRRAEDGSPA